MATSIIYVQSTIHMEVETLALSCISDTSQLAWIVCYETAAVNRKLACTVFVALCFVVKLKSLIGYFFSLKGGSFNPVTFYYVA